MRMQLLRKVASFGTKPEIMKSIYIHIIRVILEGSCEVWAGALTLKNRRALERCQKLSLKIILPNHKYKSALKFLNLEDLETRRKKITLKFAKNAKNHSKLAHLFIENIKVHEMKTRKSPRYTIKANTDRYKKSPILYMKKLLNELK